MPYKDPENRRVHCRQYQLIHQKEIAAQRKQYYDSHREELLLKKKSPEYKAKRKEIYSKSKGKLKRELLERYSNGELHCARCGITDIDVLCLDHINGGGEKHRKLLGLSSGSCFYSWLKRNSYPDGYQVLCANCNLKKRIREKC